MVYGYVLWILVGMIAERVASFWILLFGVWAEYLWIAKCTNIQKVLQSKDCKTQVFSYSIAFTKVSNNNMAEGNDPLFTIAHAWLQVTPSVRPCSFAAMRIQHGGLFHYSTSFKRK